MATGTITLTDIPGGRVVRTIKWTAISDNSGVVATDAINMSGLLIEATSAPGTPTPSAYNFQLRRGTVTSPDLLSALGAVRSTTLEESVRPKDVNGNATVTPFDNDILFMTADSVGANKQIIITARFLQQA